MPGQFCVTTSTGFHEPPKTKFRKTRLSFAKEGVRYIVTVSHGEYDLGDRYDIGHILKFVVAVWASCEFSRQLGRRVALARRNAAMDGKRPGGRLPYGWQNDGQGGLKHGKPEHVRTVKFIFDQYANKGQSLNVIATQLNQVRKTPGPRGKQWYVATIKALLENPVYAGELRYGCQRSSAFFTTDADGEVIAVEKATAPGKVWQFKGKYKPMVSRATWDRTQQHSRNVRTKGARKRKHALAGILAARTAAERCTAPSKMAR